jgi:hypothetical protein
MRHLSVTECVVADGAMQDFVNSVQQWERAALAHDAAPEYHAVLIDPERPGTVLVLTQFTDAETAARFASSGLMERFMEGVVRCSIGTASRRSYELFYAAGGDGPKAVFGETPREP